MNVQDLEHIRHHEDESVSTAEETFIVEDGVSICVALVRMGNVMYTVAAWNRYL